MAGPQNNNTTENLMYLNTQNTGVMPSVENVGQTLYQALTQVFNLVSHANDMSLQVNNDGLNPDAIREASATRQDENIEVERQRIAENTLDLDAIREASAARQAENMEIDRQRIIQNTLDPDAIRQASAARRTENNRLEEHVQSNIDAMTESLSSGRDPSNDIERFQENQNLPDSVIDKIRVGHRIAAADGEVTPEEAEAILGESSPIGNGIEGLKEYMVDNHMQNQNQEYEQNLDNKTDPALNDTGPTLGRP